MAYINYCKEAKRIISHEDMAILEFQFVAGLVLTYAQPYQACWTWETFPHFLIEKAPTRVLKDQTAWTGDFLYLKNRLLYQMSGLWNQVEERRTAAYETATKGENALDGGSIRHHHLARHHESKKHPLRKLFHLTP